MAKKLKENNYQNTILPNIAIAIAIANRRAVLDYRRLQLDGLKEMILD